MTPPAGAPKHICDCDCVCGVPVRGPQMCEDCALGRCCDPVTGARKSEEDGDDD